MIGSMKRILFRLFFIMTEGVMHDSSSAMLRKLLVVLAIDFLQVIRVMSVTKLGWSVDSYNMIKNVDPVYGFTSLASRVVPRFTFFAFAAVMVSGALTNAAYVMYLFQNGQVKKMWSVKLLRFLSASLITVFFSSVIKWLLIPIDCLVSREDSLSEFIRGEGAECTPFATPELFATIPTLFLVVGYVIFALVTSFLSFEVNPLSRNWRASNTGRVEIWWACTKVSATFIVFLSDWLTPLFCASFLLLMSGRTLYVHLQLMPFHSVLINCVRGGIYGMITWLALSCVLVSGIVVLGHESWEGSDQLSVLESGCQALLPVFFIVGCITAYMRYRTITRFVGRLRGEFEILKEVQNSGVQLKSVKISSLTSPSETNTEDPEGEESRSEDMKQSARSRSEAGKTAKTFMTGKVSVKSFANERPLFYQFFKQSWGGKRAFRDSSLACAVVRILLQSRDVEDLEFMHYILKRGLEENPGCHDLMTLYAMFLRFVFLDIENAEVYEATLKSHAAKMGFDHQYIVYALETKATQEGASASIGKGTISAIHLMEFNNGFGEAKKYHKACVQHMREFWKIVLRRRNKFTQAEAQDLLISLDAHEKALARAQQEYISLLDKYPSSVQLLYAYAGFCDTVLNSEKESLKKKAEAQALEDDSDVARKVEEEVRDDRTASSSSEGNSHRGKVRRYLNNWLVKIMQEEIDEALKLRFKIQTLLCLMVLVCTALFIFSDDYLFSSRTSKAMEAIEETGVFAANLMDGVYNLRNMQISSHLGDHVAFEKWRSSVEVLAEKMRNVHHEHYLHIPNHAIEEYYHDVQDSHKWKLVLDKWKYKNVSYLDLGHDLPRRLQRASQATVQELLNSDYSPRQLSDEKRNLVIIQENLMRTSLPAYEKILSLYRGVVSSYGSQSEILVGIVIGANLMLVLLTCGYIVWTLASVIQSLQHRYVTSCLAMAMPRNILHKMFHYYDDMYKELDKEELEEANLIENVGQAEPLNPVEEESGLMGDDEEMNMSFTVMETEHQHNKDITSQDEESGTSEARVPVRQDHQELSRSGSIVRPLTLENVRAFTHEDNDEERRKHTAELIPTRLASNFQHRGDTQQDLTSMESNEKEEDRSAGSRDLDSKISDEQGTPEHEAQGFEMRQELSNFLSSEVVLVQKDQGDEQSGADGAEESGLEGVQTPPRDHGVDDSSEEMGWDLRWDGLNKSPEGAELRGALGSPTDHQLPHPSAPESAEGDELPGAGGPGAGQPGDEDPGFDAEESGADGAEETELEEAEESEAEGSGGEGVDEAEGAAAADSDEFGEPEDLEISLQPDKNKDISALIQPALERVRKESGKQYDSEASEDKVPNDEQDDPWELHNVELVARTREAHPPHIRNIMGHHSILKSRDASPLHSPTNRNVNPHHLSFKLAGTSEIIQPVAALEEQARFQTGNKLTSQYEDVDDGTGVFHGSLKRISIEIPPGSDENQGGNGAESAPFDPQNPFFISPNPDSSHHHLGNDSQSGDDSGVNSNHSKQSRGRRKSVTEIPSNVMKRMSLVGANLLDDLKHVMGTPVHKKSQPANEDPNGLQEIRSEFLHLIGMEVLKYQSFLTRKPIYFSVIALMVGLCVFHMAFPARRIPQLTRLGPTTEQADRRIYLIKSCSHLARELVLNDGMTRLRKDELASGLLYELEELERADKAVRFGGDYGIDLGADFHNPEHNVIMYSEGCMWRDDPTNCSSAVRPEAVNQGLAYLLQSYMDAVRAIIDDYADLPLQYSESFKDTAGSDRTRSWNEVIWRQEAYETLLADENFAFMEEVRDDDLVKGLSQVMRSFVHETDHILEEAHLELRVCFGVYIFLLVFLLYFQLFRRTVLLALKEAQVQKDFMIRFPLHILTDQQADTVKEFFSNKQLTHFGSSESGGSGLDTSRLSFMDRLGS